MEPTKQHPFQLEHFDKEHIAFSVHLPPPLSAIRFMYQDEGSQTDWEN